MQRDPSDMDGNRQRPASPGSADNAPSPSKRPRLDGGPFNPAQGGMMPNGRPVGQGGVPGQQVGTGPPNPQQVQHLLSSHGINPNSLTPDQIQTFTNQSPAVQAKTIATYATSLQQHHNNQLPNKQPMPNVTGPQAQGSPMIPQGPDSAALNAYYNAGDMVGPNVMRPTPGAAGQAGAQSNHALQDYQMQLMLLEQQNKKRLMMARQEQDGMAGIARPEGGPPGPGGPGAAPGGPAGQQLQGASPQGGRTGASPNPGEQMRRNQQHMGGASIGSPITENPQSRGSPSAMNFMAAGAQIDTNTAPNFFKGMENNMVAVQMNGMRPPSSHPGQPFNGQMSQQQMMAAQQRQQQGGPGGPQMQWQQGGPNGGQIGPQGPQGQQLQGTPQPRSMPPPSAPGANTNQRNQTASPQTSNAAPPTPQQSTKAGPKKKDTKGGKSKVSHEASSGPVSEGTDKSSQAAAQKKPTAAAAAAAQAQAQAAATANAGATPAADAPAETEVPTPATPHTPVNAASFGKGQNAAAAALAPNGSAPAAATAAPAAVPAPQPDPMQNPSFGMDGNPMVSVDPALMGEAGVSNEAQGSFDLGFNTDPLGTDNVLNDFDFDSFLHETAADDNTFDFSTGAFNIGDASEIGAD